jgi:hypothetical protein
MRDVRLLSNRVKKIPSTQVSGDRYNFLDLANAEPDLGVPLVTQSVPSSDTNGNRGWLSFNDGIEILPDNTINVDDTIVRTTSPQTIADAKTFSGIISFTNATNTTGTGTGAIQVDGGVSVDQDVWIGGNVTLEGDIIDSIALTGTVQTTIETTALTAIDNFLSATYRSARYLVQISQGSSYQVSEISVIHDGTTAYSTEYSVLETSGELGILSTDVNAGSVRLLVVMASSVSAIIKIHKILIEV